MLDWAARQAGVTLRDVASQISARRFDRIEAGELTPTQAEKFAKLVNVPFGFLFFEEPPAERELPIADLRSTPDAEPLGQEFFAVYDDVVYKQSWYRDYLQSIASEPLTFVGRFASGRADVTAATVARDIERTLGLTRTALRSLRGSEDLYAFLAERVEANGILVFKNGVVGNNTRRHLPVSQFRGFAIVDEYAPAVFVNGADAKAAWAFTLLHEVAHIWVGSSAVSDVAVGAGDRTEVLCNAVAAELLVPAAEFVREWNEAGNYEPLIKIDVLRRHFKVSGLVVARRALDRGFIDRAVYRAVYDAAKKEGADSSGGNFYATLGARNGKRFARTVADLAHAGEISLRLAGRLLNTTPSNVLNYHDRTRALPA